MKSRRLEILARIKISEIAPMETNFSQVFKRGFWQPYKSYVLKEFQICTDGNFWQILTDDNRVGLVTPRIIGALLLF